MSNERSRDFSGAPSQGSSQGADRRDPGADALLELARLIGGKDDPFGAEASKVEPRLSDVSRAAVSGRREPDAPAVGATLEEPRADTSRTERASRFDFPGPTDHGDAGDRRGPVYRRRHEEYSGPHAGGGGGYDEPEDYEDDSEGPRRRRAKMIIAVLGLAVFGSAAAYGYRTLLTASPSGPPPIINADNSPSKITRMSDVKAESGRIGDRVGGERMVRRDEDPVDVGTSFGAGGPGGGASDVVPAPATRAAPLPSDPKRVQTVPIRAEQTASAPDRPAQRPAASQSQSQVPAQAQPRQLAAQPAPQPAAPPPQQRQVAAAAVSAPADTPAAAPLESGGYVVQLVAVHSEADAQSEFRRLQAKYSSVLSGRQPLIRRKDRGEQVFFAAQVGPFGAKSEADQFCGELKAAGGSCYVQRN
jgi:cell division septation protein DedD